MLPPALLRRALFPLLGSALLLAPSCANALHPAAATVGDARISDSELRATIPVLRFLASVQQIQCGQTGSGESQSSACARFALSELIQGQAARTYAAQHGIALPKGELANALTSVEQRFGGHAQLLQQLARAHSTYPELAQLVSTILLVNRVAGAVTPQVVSEQQLEQRYAQERLQFTLVHAAHILVRSKALADRIAREVTPRNFAALAKRFSIDPGTAPNGGDLGTFRAEGSGVPLEFVQAALSLRPGQISGPVHTQLGWHIIRLISAQLIPFQQARPQIVQQLSAQGFTEWMARRAGGIRVNPRFGAFDPSLGRVDLVCSTSAASPCPEPSPTAAPTA